MIEQITHWLQDFAWMLPWIACGLVLAYVLWLIVYALLQGFERRRLLSQDVVFLELTPPANSDETPEATQQLFAVLHGLDGTRSIKEKILQHRSTFSLEIVATKQNGIRYLLRVPKNDVTTFEQTLVSYVPEIKLRRVDDFVSQSVDPKTTQTLQFRQTGHFAYPLHTQLSLGQHDPMAYLTGAMTKLDESELIAFQVVATPVRVREAESIAGRMMHNDELVYKLGGRRMPASKIFEAIGAVLFSVLDAIGDIASPTASKYSSQYSDERRKHEVAAKIKPARMLSALEEALAESVDRKLQQPLFCVDIRAFIVSASGQERRQRAIAIRNAIDSFKISKYQAIRARYSLLVHNHYRRFVFVNRLPSLFRRNACILSAAEIADLYHFPNPTTAKTEDVVKSLSKTLPAPLAIKNGKFDVVIGQNIHHGTVTNIGLTAQERERHVFVVGGTGNGKTTLLKYAIIQDIRNGKGVAVIDPHGDLAQEILAYIPEERLNDVIYFNPSDLAYPIGLNLLEVPEGLTGDQLADAKDFIAETVVSVMRKTFSDDGTGGHRIEYMLRNAVLTALTVKDATLFTVYDLLTDSKFRKPIVAALEQDWLKNFWNNEYGKAGDYQQVKMMSGVTSKIGRYHASVSADRILSQPKSTINFEEILDGKILICNLAKGLIGEDTSEVFGISILAKLQLASFQRIKKKQANRKPFFAYVDEFQNFATVSFTEMLSEARKYRLFLIMAEQTTAQQEDQRIVNKILTNAGTIICFKTNSPDDEDQALRLMNSRLQPGEIMNLPTYNFYIRLAGTQPQEPTSGQTILPDNDGDEAIAERAIELSRKNYATKYVAPIPKPKTKTKTESKKSAKTKSKQEDNIDERFGSNKPGRPGQL